MMKLMWCLNRLYSKRHLCVIVRRRLQRQQWQWSFYSRKKLWQLHKFLERVSPTWGYKRSIIPQKDTGRTPEALHCTSVRWTSVCVRTVTWQVTSLVAVVALPRVHALITAHPVGTFTWEVSRLSTVVARAAAASTSTAAHSHLSAVTWHVSRLATVVAAHHSTTTASCTSHTSSHTTHDIIHDWSHINIQSITVLGEVADDQQYGNWLRYQHTAVNHWVPLRGQVNHHSQFNIQ